MFNIQTTTNAYDLLHDSSAREAEREWLKRLQNRDWLDPLSNRQYRDGISVIIPAHRAAATIQSTLQSLAEQTMPAGKFEILIICNGEDDGTESIARDAQSEYHQLNIRIFYSDIPNAGAARNLGVSVAHFEYVSFVDADDRVEPLFLENAFSHASEDCIVASPIINCFEEDFDYENSLNKRIIAGAGTTVPLTEVPWLLGFNACKLVSIQHLSRFEYRTDLRSGEDLVYFANLLSVPRLKAVFPESLQDAAYLRNLRPDSISRQEASFDFNVRQRVDCIAALQNIPVTGPAATSRESLQHAQLGFVQRYLSDHPFEADKLEYYLAEIGFVHFPWKKMNAGKARDLAISYCFSPFSDTSAVVAEKAIAERRNCVDVISNDMSEVRSVDDSLSFLSSRWIDRRILIDTTPSFAGWDKISLFAEKALTEAERLNKSKQYRTLYSRALWVGSHVAGALFKNRNPQVHWTAEFSDPLRFGVDGEKRSGNFSRDKVSDILFDIISSRGVKDIEIESLFDLVEAATLSIADEVIFTNENQMEYMLTDYPQSLKEIVSQKATVRPHPTPSPSSYFVAPTSYSVLPVRVNLGYFGSFYSNRGLGDIFTALINTKPGLRNRIALHIFCNSVDSAKEEVRQWGLQDVVHVNPYLPYMEFLNASTKFDVLIVNDISRGPGFQINPFLPSKLSDYRGSGARIWGLIDSGSPLSKQTLDFETAVGNSAQIVNTLEEIVASVYYLDED